MGQGAAGDRAAGEKAARVRRGTIALDRGGTFAWPGRYRRLKSDYVRLPETTEGHHSHRHDWPHGT
jgi:hypothetical protein